jgi:F5/8 type C domain
MRKVLALDPTNGRLSQTADMVEATDATTTPTGSKIPKALPDGTLASGWLPTAKIRIREVDGFPDLATIDEIVVGNGDLTLISGTTARLKTASDVVGGGGGGGSSLTVAELDGTPLVANVTELRVPNASLIELGGGAVALAFPAGIGGTGMTNPMNAAGDMIVGVAPSTTNEALTGLGVISSESGHYFDGWGGDYHHPKGIDANDATYWSPGPCAGNWLRVDLGSAKLITAWRVLQHATYYATAFKIQSSDDGSTWVDRALSGLAGVESGVVALVTTASARYWRLLGVTGPTPWQVATFELHSGSPAGTAACVGIGDETDVLTVYEGAPAWRPATGSSDGVGALLYLWSAFI